MDRMALRNRPEMADAGCAIEHYSMPAQRNERDESCGAITGQERCVYIYFEAVVLETITVYTGEQLDMKVTASKVSPPKSTLNVRLTTTYTSTIITPTKSLQTLGTPTRISIHLTHHLLPLTIPHRQQQALLRTAFDLIMHELRHLLRRIFHTPTHHL